MAVTPEVATPGDTVTLDLLLTNARFEAAIPEILITLPANISLDPNDLPAGTSFSIQTNTLNWQPLVPAGGSNRLQLPMSVNVVTLSQPDQIVVAQLRDGDELQEVTANFWVGVMPQAVVIFDPPQAAVGQPVQLRANISGSGPFIQSWSLGDGRVIDVSDPVVVFSAAGTYQVTVQVSNPLGRVTAASLITVVAVPAARFTLDDATPGISQPVTFINESGGQGQLTYFWDFGDGTMSQEANPSHQYLMPGNYTVRLIVQNEFGQSETTQVITVGQPPTADIFIAETGQAGQLLTAQVLTDETVTNVEWDMGDGWTYEGANISHVYWRAGDFNITMTASNDYGSFQLTRWVHIEAGALAFYLPIVRKGGQSDVIPGIGADGSGALPKGNILNPARTEAAAFEPQSLTPYNFPPQLTLQEQLLAYINQAREVNGVPPVTYVHELSLAAQSHTDDVSTNSLTGHIGSDGSSPPLRLLRSGYPGGYGGEATAWGFQTAIEPVEFWLNSPPHRAIILNPYITNIGIGYTLNLNAPNVWYWTALFASLNLPVVSVPEVTPVAVGTPTPVPVIQLLGPPQNSEFALAADNNLIFTWSWPLPLEEGQRFVVYLKSGRTFQIGTVQQPLGNNQYQFKTQATNVPVSPGLYEWQVRLENLESGEVLEESPFWPVNFLPAGSAPPTPTSDGTGTAAEPITTPEPPNPAEPTPTPIPIATP
jgi:PKD repeat protein